MRLPRWRAAAELITLADIAVAPRPGCRWSPAELERQLPGISTRICELPGPALSISSQRVRQAIAAGQPIDDLVPTPVAHAIAAMGLYRPGAVPAPDG
jgi:nicotinate-nucleotide adenylyltransferase